MALKMGLTLLKRYDIIIPMIIRINGPYSFSCVTNGGFIQWNNRYAVDVTISSSTDVDIVRKFIRNRADTRINHMLEVIEDAIINDEIL